MDVVSYINGVIKIYKLLLFNIYFNTKHLMSRNFWVVDPLKPNKSHMHRRIHLSQSVSVIVKIDPLNPTAVPQINFLGTESEVNKQEDNVNIHVSPILAYARYKINLFIE